MFLKTDGGANMEKRIQDELNILKDIILDTVPVEQIFLFGSYASVQVVRLMPGRI
jgi:predicted nucleotidyltransferase